MATLSTRLSYALEFLDIVHVLAKQLCADVMAEEETS